MFVALENAVHYQVEGHEVLSLDSLLKGVMKSQGVLEKHHVKFESSIS